MPLYEYECPDCGHTEEDLRAVEFRDQAPWCLCGRDHTCGTKMERIVSTPQSYIGSTDRPTRGQG